VSGYRLLCDENIDPRAVDALSDLGIDAAHVNDAPGAGSDDPAVAARARSEGRRLLTNDTGFLDETRYPDVTVLYLPRADVPVGTIHDRIRELRELVPDSENLPTTVFLAAEYD
jgi:predicted nuclease of predicted toxin-antitoxin system